MSRKRGELSLGCGITVLAVVFVPMFLLSLGGGLWGWYQIVEQDRVLGTGKDVEAKVIHSEVVWHPGGANTRPSYEPVISFSYAVDGTTYESPTVVPGRVEGTHGWAHGIVRDYSAGRITTAYYDPADPSTAFLIKQYINDPYLFTAFSGLFAAVAIVFPASFFWPWPRIRTSMALLGLIVFEVPVVAASWHYLNHMSPQHPQSGPWMYGAIGLGLIPCLLAVRWWHLDPKKIKAKQDRTR